MTFTEQIALWFNRQEYQKIIDAIRALPEAERTGESLARLDAACDHLAAADSKGSRADILELDTTLFGHLCFPVSEGLFETFPLAIDGRSFQANLYLWEDAVNCETLPIVREELERVPQMYRAARRFLYDHLKVNQMIRDFIQNHRECLEPECLCGYFQIGSPEELTDELFYEKLELRTLAIKPQEDGEDCTLDFSIDKEFSDELLVVRFDRAGNISDLCWES